MSDSLQLKEASVEPNVEQAKEVEEKPMELDECEENNSLDSEKQEEINLKNSGSPALPVSDLKNSSKSSPKTLPLSSSVRSTRSKDNPDFVAKQKSFMAKVQAATSIIEPNSPSGDRPDTPGKRKRENNTQLQSGKKKKTCRNDTGSQVPIKEWQNDNCCWECHREGQFICCEMCPRVFHLKCAGLEKEPEEDWACSECHAVMQAENVENRSRAMQLISVDQLCILLKYALNRLKTMPVMEPFSKPVDVNEFPTYWDIVVHPVDFSSLERNIKKKFYGSTEAFLSDARWIVHNSVIFNGANSKVTSLAKTLIKILKQELSEIETCPDCYENAHKKPDRWFSEACRLAHPLVWARLKGFPFWPAKAVKWKDTNVDVRFFGRHDRSWVPLKECFLFSEQMPTPLKNRNKTLETCLLEVSEHIKKLKERFGKFKYAPHRLPFNPYDNDQIRILLPLYKGPTILRIRSQTVSSKQPGHSGTDDETSSIASTDSGNSSYSRWRKRTLRDRSALNTPDTETETDNLSLEGDILNKYDNKECESPNVMKEEKEDGIEGVEDSMIEENCTFSNVDENEPPDKLDVPLDSIEGNNGGEEDEEEEDGEKEIGLEAKMLEDNEEEEEPVPDLSQSCENEETFPCQNETLEDKDEILNCKDSNLSSVPDNSENIKDNESSDKVILSENTELNASSPETVDDKTLLLNNIEKVEDLELKSGLKSISLKVTKITVEEVKEEKSDSRDVSSPSNPEQGNTGTQHKSEEKGENETNFSLKDEEEKKANSSEDLTLKNENKNEEIASTKEESENEENPAKDAVKNVAENQVIIGKQPDLDKLEDLVDENARNFERINELLRKEALKEIGCSEENLVSSELARDSHIETKNEKTDDNEKEELNIHNDESDKNKTENKTNSSDVSESNDEKDSSKKDKIEEMMDDDYFQGFIDEINLRKKVESFQEIMKNARLEGSCDDENMLSDNEEDKSATADTLDTDYNEQLLANTSLTIGKVSLPKSLNIQKISEKNENFEEDMEEKFSLPSVNIKSLLGTGKSEECPKKNNDNEEVMESVDEAKLKEEFSKEANSSIIDFQNYANKIFHNITISSKSLSAEKEVTSSSHHKTSKPHSQTGSESEKDGTNALREKREHRKSKEMEKTEQEEANVETQLTNSVQDEENEKPDSLLEAVKLVTKIGNIAIKRVDSQTLEHTSGSDRVTISVANSTNETSKGMSDHSSSKSKSSSSKDKRNENPLVNLGTSVSVTKASEKEKEKEKEKVKMPSGVDTTRLSPSISIIPVASSSSSEKPKDKITSTIGPSTTPQSSSVTTPTTTTTTAVCSSSVSPSVSFGGSTTPSSSISASPNIPPPPLLSHSLPSPTNSNVRNIFGPPMSGMGMGNGPRTPITSPGLRMMANAQGMMMGGRFPGPSMVRHLPPEAGPLSTELHKHAHKLAEMMRTSLEEVLGGLVGLGTPEARLGALQLELERCNWRHQQEIIEVRHNADVMLVEMRANLEAEKQRAIEDVRRQMEQKLTELRRQMEMQLGEKLSEVKRQADIEKQRAIEETKKKQWCANCGKEALFFCCWNTSYCDYPCQQAHWPQHMSVCGQNSDSGGGNQSNTEGGAESINGDASTHSSRGTTPIQGHHGGQIKNLIEDEDSFEESKPKRNRIDNPSPIFSDSMGRAISPAGSGGLVNSPHPAMGGTSPLGQPLGSLGPGSMRPGMGAPSMAAIAAMSGNHNANHGMGMKMPRFMQHSMLQQQSIFGGMDPRMMMMMGRNMHNPAAAAMMRSHLQPFRPRFM